MAIGKEDELSESERVNSNKIVVVPYCCKRQMKSALDKNTPYTISKWGKGNEIKGCRNCRGK